MRNYRLTSAISIYRLVKINKEIEGENTNDLQKGDAARENTSRTEIEIYR